MKRSTNIILIIFITINLLFSTSLFILYGPIDTFRTFWITTAMSTMTHQNLAHWFYSDKIINKVMANNKVIESEEPTNIKLIKKVNNEKQVYVDSYDEQILKRDKGNDLYKVINVSSYNYKGYLVAIYDPSRISLAMTRFLNNKGEILTDIAKNNKAVVAVNASGFIDPDGMGSGALPTGSVIQNGKIVYSSPSPGRDGGVIGFDKNNNLILTKENMNSALSKYKLRDAVEFGPFLIVNGKKSNIIGNGGFGIHPRTVIGQRSDGIVLLLIIDGRSIESLGADMNDLIKIMTNYKAINAANLDGGASTTLVVNNKVVNNPATNGPVGQRRLPNAWIIK